MTSTVSLTDQVTQARNELHNLRKKVRGLQEQHKKEVSRLESLLTSSETLNIYEDQRLPQKVKIENCNKEHLCRNWTPIGYISSWFRTKNGTPRQGSVSTLTRGKLKLEKYTFNNPQHSLQGLEQYSHVWIFFVFDQNTGSGKGHKKSKVSPPRLNGERVGVFSTRSPHRPNPLGLTLAHLEKVEDDCLFLSGLDILDGTPVLDIKPYILQYDAPSSIVRHTDVSISLASCEDLAQSETLAHNKSLSIFQNNTQKSVLIGRDDFNEPNIKDTKNSISYSQNIDNNLKGNEVSEEEIHNCHSFQHCDANNYFIEKHVDSIETDGAIQNADQTIDSDKQVNTEKSPKPLNEEKKNCHSVLSNHYNIHQNNETMHHQQALRQKNSSIKSRSMKELGVVTASWVKSPPIAPLSVCFNPIAENQINSFSIEAEDACYRLEFLADGAELKSAITQVLCEDPRSTYRRQKCPSQLYYFTVDTAHITAWFEESLAEVLRVRPLDSHGLNLEIS